MSGEVGKRIYTEVLESTEDTERSRLIAECGSSAAAFAFNTTAPRLSFSVLYVFSAPSV